jgi:hypothetical protein
MASDFSTTGDIDGIEEGVLPVSVHDRGQARLIVWRPHRLTVMGAINGENGERLPRGGNRDG